MNVFWVVNGKKLKQFIVVITALIFAAGIAYAEKDNIAVFVPAASEPTAIYKIDTNEKVVALTFDISWGDQRAIPILDILQDKKVDKATFFISAPWSQNHPEIVKRIMDQQYEIGSHGYKHVYYSRLSDEEIRNQILKSHRILKEVTGQTPTLLRPPNGDFDKRVLKIADELGYKVIQWNIDSQDWLNPGVDKIVENVLNKVHPGAIILMHASDSIKQTHLALPVIIDQLRAKGYKFVTVTELISGGKPQTKEVQ